MTPPKNYFEILGVKEGANQTEIKRAFKELAFRYHPDRNPHNPKAEEKFKEVAEAYAYLSGNQELFEAFHRPETTAGEVGEILSDVFDEIFGTSEERWVPPGKDIYLLAELTLREAFEGTEQRFGFFREFLCEDCGGRGGPSGERSPTCSYCFGRGSISVPHRGEKIDRICPKCQGLGRIPQHPCRKCRGKGAIARKQKMKIAVPPRVQHGQVLQFPGQGSLAAHSSRPGDLFLQISILPDKSFTFDGPHILCEVPLTFFEATRGGMIPVPTLKGEVSVEVPPGTQSGQSIRLTGLGLGGDQIVRWKVIPPEEFQSSFPHRPSHVSFWSRIKRFLFH